MFRALALRFRRVPSDPPPPPWRRRFVLFLKRWKRTIAFAGLVTALLGWAAWPHLSAQIAGLLAERRGHDVEWDHYLSEEIRWWAPLSTDAAVWKTPVCVFINYDVDDGDVDEDGRRDHPETFSDALDRVENMPSVNDLRVYGCAVSLTDAERFSAIHEAEFLLFYQCDFAPGAVTEIAKRGGYGFVDLSHCTLPPGELAQLAKNQTLFQLRVSDIERVGGQFAAFADHPKLVGVLADRTDFNDADLRAVVRCEQMSRLHLEETAVTDAGFAELPELPSLTILRLANTPVTDATVRRLAERCPNLYWLDLSGTQVTDDALPHLARLTSLQYLNLAGTRVTAAAADPAFDWPALEDLSLPVSLIEGDATALVWGRESRRRGGPTFQFEDPPE
ncbi:leucine-rich repeat domain-containing protein [Alienimonas chondri]|uniref:leucine-rich repeat domain-containing protein n=1 Tax=Alienimonas chondri TaxID=2681879 RepID=UPI0014887FD7|nr:hypothetical protein [Alienimonas chondri]